MNCAATANTKGAAGDAVAYHHFLELRRPVQGRGFHARWARHLDGLYAWLGVTEIRAFAALDGGGYAAAKAGFDFAAPAGPDRRALIGGLFAEHCRARLDELVAGGRINGGVAARTVEHILTRADDITAHELATLGADCAGTDGDRRMHLGKALMRGARYHAVRPVPAVDAAHP
jgi:hypothetical protein